MSHLDAKAEFSDAQAVTATAISSNVMDTKGGGLSPNLTVNQGLPGLIYLVVSAASDFTGSGTIAASLVSDSAAGLATSPTVHAQGAALVGSDVSAGGVILVAALPPGDYKEFLGIKYTVTGTVSASVNAYLTLDPYIWKAYKDAAPVGPWDEEASINSVTVTPATASVVVGATDQLSAVVDGDSTNSVTWASSNTAIATVSTAGLVTGVAAGSATITATSTADTSVSDTAAITVTAASGS